MATSIELHYPPFYLATRGIFKPAALADDCTGAFWFTKKSAESQESAAQRGTYNKAIGASNAASDRRQPGGIAEYFTNYARFQEATPILTNIPDFGSTGGCVFVVARTEDDTIGATSSDRAFVVGNYGGNTNHGFGFEFNSDISSVARALDYPGTGSVQVNQIDMGSSTDDLEKWRLYYAETGRVSGGDKLLSAVNLNPGDGTIPDPTDTTLTSGRTNGSQTFTIGGRISDSSTIYTPTCHKDIALVLIFHALPTTEQRNLIKSQCELFCTLVGITLGS